MLQVSWDQNKDGLKFHLYCVQYLDDRISDVHNRCNMSMWVCEQTLFLTPSISTLLILHNLYPSPTPSHITPSLITPLPPPHPHPPPHTHTHLLHSYHPPSSNPLITTNLPTPSLNTLPNHMVGSPDTLSGKTAWRENIFNDVMCLLYMYSILGGTF